MSTPLLLRKFAVSFCLLIILSHVNLQHFFKEKWHSTKWGEPILKWKTNLSQSQFQVQRQASPTSYVLVDFFELRQCSVSVRSVCNTIVDEEENERKLFYFIYVTCACCIRSYQLNFIWARHGNTRQDKTILHYFLFSYLLHNITLWDHSGRE